MTTLEEDNVSGFNHEDLFSKVPLTYLTALSIIGDKVYNDAGEHMGHIKDIMINIVDGSIEYFVVEFGGFLGIGVKYFAIPFHLLRVDPPKKAFTFSQSREMLEKAPGFDMEHWPFTNIHMEKVYSYWSFMG